MTHFRCIFTSVIALSICYVGSAWSNSASYAWCEKYGWKAQIPRGDQGPLSGYHMFIARTASATDMSDTCAAAIAGAACPLLYSTIACSDSLLQLQQACAQEWWYTAQQPWRPCADEDIVCSTMESAWATAKPSGASFTDIAAALGLPVAELQAVPGKACCAQPQDATAIAGSRRTSTSAKRRSSGSTQHHSPADGVSAPAEYFPTMLGFGAVLAVGGVALLALRRRAAAAKRAARDSWYTSAQPRRKTGVVTLADYGR